MTETRPAPAEITGDRKREQERPQPLRTVIVAALSVACLVLLVLAAMKGVDTVNTFRGSSPRGGFLTEKQTRCLEARLPALVPSGARVYIDVKAKDVNPKVGTHREPWHLIAISLPDHTLLDHPESGAYRLSVAPVAGTPEQPGDCDVVRLVAEELP